MKVYEYDNEGIYITTKKFEVEYADCGSHSMEIKLSMDLEDINNFLAQFNIPPLKPLDTFPPKAQPKKGDKVMADKQPNPPQEKQE